MARAVAVYIRCRYASTTATDTRADADVLPNDEAAKPRGRIVHPIPTRQLLSGHCLGERLVLCATQGCPPEFLKMLDDKKLGFADFRGTRQYISVGNVGANDRAALMLMDYPNRRRLKI